mmetsp:Transcript_3902/g.10725  ORF Transcript_3902/g.10725 Transcript_3902/m.10725 type:complete len:269 (-) Transcript_3902:1635-2441(-)
MGGARTPFRLGDWATSRRISSGERPPLPMPEISSGTTRGVRTGPILGVFSAISGGAGGPTMGQSSARKRRLQSRLRSSAPVSMDGTPSGGGSVSASEGRFLAVTYHPATTRRIEGDSAIFNNGSTRSCAMSMASRSLMGNSFLSPWLSPASSSANTRALHPGASTCRSVPASARKSAPSLSALAHASERIDSVLTGRLSSLVLSSESAAGQGDLPGGIATLRSWQHPLRQEESASTSSACSSRRPSTMLSILRSATSASVSPSPSSSW